MVLLSINLRILHWNIYFNIKIYVVTSYSYRKMEINWQIFQFYRIMNCSNVSLNYLFRHPDVMFVSMQLRFLISLSQMKMLLQIYLQFTQFRWMYCRGNQILIQMQFNKQMQRRNFTYLIGEHLLSFTL